MERVRSRALAFGALTVAAVGVVVAVTSALGAQTGTAGVAAAQATRIRAVTHVVHAGGARITVTSKPSGAVCFRAPHVASCAASLAAGQLAYATGKSGRREVLAGVAGPDVKAVIARLTRRGTVWPALSGGAFYAVLPRGDRLRAVVKVLAGGRRVTFPVSR
jgi:hypothetical protein